MVDTENVLLYNVGNSAVSRPAAILVERRYGPVKRPPEHAPSFEFLRHYSYNVGDAAQECYRSTERSAAVWDGQSPPARAGLLTLLRSGWTSVVLPTTLVQPSLTGNPSPSL